MRLYTMKKFMSLLNRKEDLKMALDMGASFEFNTYMNEDFPILKKAGSAYRAYWRDCKNDVYSWDIDRFTKEIKKQMRLRGQLSKRNNEYIDMKAITREFLASPERFFTIKCITYGHDGEEVTFILDMIDERHMALTYGHTSHIFDITESNKDVNVSVNEFIRQHTGKGFLYVRVNNEYGFSILGEE